MSEPIRSISRLGRTIFVTLLLANTAVWVGCGEEPAPAAPVARPVKILTIDAQGAVETFEYSGTIAAAQHSEMAFEVPGKITDFPVVEGQVVKQGDLLVRIERNTSG